MSWRHKERVTDRFRNSEHGAFYPHHNNERMIVEAMPFLLAAISAQVSVRGGAAQFSLG